ncbi:MAG: hypothetical protein VZQ62_00785 [Methanosphaera sp.]|nr:hypothetical protein [Methanosphaera sp.]
MWKIYMYVNNQYIKKIRLKDVSQLFNSSYVINIWFKKYIFGTIYTKAVVKPKLLKKTIEDKKQIHVEIDFERGVEV